MASVVFLIHEQQALPIRVMHSAACRSLRVTVSVGGEARLTAPAGLPMEAVCRFLDSNRELIGQRVLAARAAAEALPPVEETSFLWLGRTLPVETREGTRSQARLAGDRVRLTLPRGEWAHGALLRLRQRLALPYMTQLAQGRAAQLGLEPVTVSVTGQGRYFGQCRPRSRQLTFSLYLTRMPEEVILSVVDHELCHLTHPNHSPRFYELLTQYCPRHREHTRQLNEQLTPYMTSAALQRREHRPHPALSDFNSIIL